MANLIKNFYKDGKSEGNAYYFYDTTGALKNFRFFKNGKEYDGLDFWNDSLCQIKSILYFNDSGQLYYKRNFDKSGMFSGEEGHK